MSNKKYVYDNETSGNPEFEQWANKLEHMSDQEVSYEIYQRIMNHSDIDKDSLRLFSEAYEYCIKLINQGKNLEPNLLKIYLQDIKGENINEVNIVNLFILLSMCGIEFSTVNMTK
jgi:hypothetical protein